MQEFTCKSEHNCKRSFIFHKLNKKLLTRLRMNSNIFIYQTINKRKIIISKNSLQINNYLIQHILYTINNFACCISQNSNSLIEIFINEYSSILCYCTIMNLIFLLLESGTFIIIIFLNSALYQCNIFTPESELSQYTIQKYHFYLHKFTLNFVETFLYEMRRIEIIIQQEVKLLENWFP